MPEAAAAFQADDRFFLTYDGFVDAIEATVGATHQSGGEPATAELASASHLEQNLRALIAKGKRTGVILDSFQERRDFQKELDYLAKLLERLHAAPEDVSLEPFQPQSLASIAVPAFPFNDALQQCERTPTPGREDLQRYLVDKARAASLRFDDGLVEEIAVQLSGDPEAWPLLWCCLGNLYARLSKEGLGNKLCRPKGSASFDCRSFAADVAKDAYQACPAQEKGSLKAVLVQLGLLDGAPAALPAALPTSRIKALAGANAANVIARLNDCRIVWQSQEHGGEPGYRLVHRSLQERWEELQAWVETQRTLRGKRKAMAWTAAAVGLLFIAVGGAIFGYLKGEAAADVAAREVAIRSLDLLSLNSDLALATAMEAVCTNKTTGLAWESVARALDSRREMYRFYPPPADRQLVVAGFMGDSAKVLTANSQGRVKLWSAQVGTDAVALPTTLVKVMLTAFSANAQRVALAGQDAADAWEAQIWNLGNGKAIGASLPQKDELSALALSSDGMRLAVGTARGVVQLYSDAGAPIGDPVNIGRPVQMLGFNFDGSLLVAATTDDNGLQGKAVVWTVQGEKLHRIGEVNGGPQEQSLAVGFADAGTDLITIGQEFGVGVNVHVINLTTFKPRTTTIPNLSVLSAVLDFEGRQVMLVGLDGTVRVWDRELSLDTLVVPSSANFWGLTGVFSLTGQEIAVKSTDSTIRVSSLRKTDVARVAEPIRSVAFSPVDGERIAAGTVKGTVYVWGIDKDGPISLRTREPDGPDNREPNNIVHSVSYSSDGARIAASYQDGLVRVWDVSRRKLERAPLKASRGEGGTGKARAVCASFSPDGKRLVTTSAGGDVGIWEGESPRWLSDQTGPATGNDAPLCATFSEDGDHVYVVLKNGHTHKWAWRTNQRQGPSTAIADGGIALNLNKATFSPQGKKVAGQSASLNGDVWLLDAESGKPLSQLSGARKVANFTGDGSRVATVDFDNVISVWDASSYRRIARLGANQTLAALSYDGANLLAVREQAWYIDRCRACGNITAAANEGALEKEASTALRGFLDDPIYEGQFSCLLRQNLRR